MISNSCNRISVNSIGNHKRLRSTTISRNCYLSVLYYVSQPIGSCSHPCEYHFSIQNGVIV